MDLELLGQKRASNITQLRTMSPSNELIATCIIEIGFSILHLHKIGYHPNAAPEQRALFLARLRPGAC